MSMMQFTQPMGFVTRVGGGQPTRRRPTASTRTRSGGSENYWLERRRHEQATERQRHPDLAVYGTAVAYGVPLDDGRGNRIMFTPDTEWQLDSPPYVPIEVEHGGTLIGMASVAEERSGLVIGDSTIYGACRHTVEDRHYLSVGLGEYTCTRRPDGVLVVDAAELREISIVGTPRWPDHCAAHIWTKSA